MSYVACKAGPGYVHYHGAEKGCEICHPKPTRRSPIKTMTLTPGQVEFLRAVMQDYIDVTADAGIRRRAKEIRAKLERLRGVDRTGEAK